MDKKVMEVISLKKAHQEQEAELKYEVDRLKDQLKKTKDEFAKEQQKSKKVSAVQDDFDHATLSSLMIFRIVFV